MSIRSSDRRSLCWVFAYVLVGLVAFSQQPASACSLAWEDELHDGFVFYGIVVAHVAGSRQGQAAWGIDVVPRYAFRMPQRTADDSYEIFPMRLTPSCDNVPTADRASIVQQFPLGSVVGVVGSAAEKLGFPGDVTTDPVGVLFKVPEGCDVDALAGMRHDYRAYDVRCGNYRFEANKDIARLESAPLERVEVLERLAFYQLTFRFADLVGRYLPEAIGLRLLDVRYSDMTDEDCIRLARNQASVPDETYARRLRERCTQSAPYQPDEPWRLYDAIRLNRLGVVRDFLAQGGDPNALLRGTPSGFVRPLEIAVRSRREQIALELLRAGADLEASGVPIASLVNVGMTRVLDAVLREDPRRLQSELGLAHACFSGYYDVFDVVIRRADAARVDIDDGLSDAAATCIAEGATDAARLLLAHGVEPTEQMLFATARSGALGMVRSLLALGVDPHARHQDPQDPGGPYDGAAAIDFAWLEYMYVSPAALRMRPYVLHELAAAGPGLKSGESLKGIAVSAMSELDRYSSPAEKLRGAVRLGLYDIIERMLADNQEWPGPVLTSAVRDALDARHPDVARLLVDAGADPGNGTLHAAIRSARPGIVAYLLARGADPDQPIDGQTPLELWWRTEARYSRETFHHLADAGADVCGLFQTLEQQGRPTFELLQYAPECAE